MPLPQINNFAERLIDQMRVFLVRGNGQFDLVNFLHEIPQIMDIPQSEFMAVPNRVTIYGNVNMPAIPNFEVKQKIIAWLKYGS